MSYNFDFLEKLVRRMPSAKQLSGAIFSVSLIFVLLWRIINGSISTESILYIIVAFNAVNFGSIIFVESLFSFIRREWVYFVSLAVFTLFGLSMLLASLFSLGATIVLLLACGNAVLLSFVGYVLIAGRENVVQIAAISVIQPMALMFIADKGLIASSEIGLEAYIFPLILVSILLLDKILNEYLFQANSIEMSGALLAYQIINDKVVDLDMGQESLVPTRTVGIKTGKGVFKGFLPWIHPGPISSFGGSRIAEESTDEENDSFFLHAPSTHQSDITSVEDSQRVEQAIKAPEKWSSEATKLETLETDHFKLRARRYGNFKVVYIGSEHFDDYERSVFDKYLERDDLAIIDIHGGDRVGGDVVNYESEYAGEVIAAIDTILEEIDSLPAEDYSAGWSIRKDKKGLMALVEKAGGEETLFFGVNENERSEQTKRVEENFKDDFDNVVVSTTDNHRSIYDQVVGFNISFEEFKGAVEEARGNLESAEMGISYKEVEDVWLFDEKYYDLLGSINILSRLYPMTVLLIGALYYASVFLVFN